MMLQIFVSIFGLSLAYNPSPQHILPYLVNPSRAMFRIPQEYPVFSTFYQANKRNNEDSTTKVLEYRIDQIQENINELKDKVDDLVNSIYPSKSTQDELNNLKEILGKKTALYY